MEKDKKVEGEKKEDSCCGVKFSCCQNHRSFMVIILVIAVFCLGLAIGHRSGRRDGGWGKGGCGFFRGERGGKEFDENFLPGRGMRRPVENAVDKTSTSTSENTKPASSTKPVK